MINTSFESYITSYAKLIDSDAEQSSPKFSKSENSPSRKTIGQVFRDPKWAAFSRCVQNYNKAVPQRVEGKKKDQDASKSNADKTSLQGSEDSKKVAWRPKEKELAAKLIECAKDVSKNRVSIFEHTQQFKNEQESVNVALALLFNRLSLIHQDNVPPLLMNQFLDARKQLLSCLDSLQGQPHRPWVDVERVVTTTMAGINTISSGILTADFVMSTCKGMSLSRAVATVFGAARQGLGLSVVGLLLLSAAKAWNSQTHEIALQKQDVEAILNEFMKIPEILPAVHCQIASRVLEKIRNMDWEKIACDSKSDGNVLLHVPTPDNGSSPVDASMDAQSSSNGNTNANSESLKKGESTHANLKNPTNKSSSGHAGESSAPEGKTEIKQIMEGFVNVVSEAEWLNADWTFVKGDIDKIVEAVKSENFKFSEPLQRIFIHDEKRGREILKELKFFVQLEICNQLDELKLRSLFSENEINELQNALEIMIIFHDTESAV